MSLLIAWVFFPLVLAVLALGCGLLLERVNGRQLPGVLLLPVGFAVMIVAGQFAIISDATAELAVPIVIGLAVAGLVSALPWRRQPDRWALGCAVAVFAAYAAPFVFSGHATIGFLGDDANWLALTDRVMDHGRSLDGLVPSTYEATVKGYLTHGYPVGALLPLGVGREIVGQDVAWLFQPYLAFIAAMLALVLYRLAAAMVESDRLRAAAAFVAGQPAILFAYTLWGGAKELAGSLDLALIAALIPAVLASEGRAGGVLPLSIATAAGLAILSFGGLAWLLPLLALTLVVAISMRARTLIQSQALRFSALTVVLWVPAIVAAFDFFDPASDLLTDNGLGFLKKPLSVLQAFGIWPTGDFRDRPDHKVITISLIALLAVGIGVTVWSAWRRRVWPVLLYLGGITIGGLIVVAFGSAWIDSKAFTIVSPAFVLAGLIGAAIIRREVGQLEAGVIAAAITIGVLLSNVLAYHDVALADRDRLAELEKIGKRFAGEGPTLMIEYEALGVRHFLREADAEAPAQLPQHPILLRTGQKLKPEALGDIDNFKHNAVLFYRTIVLRRSPAGSRPPSAYRLAWSSRHYQVWQRQAGPPPQIVAHLPLGDTDSPSSRANCRAILGGIRLYRPRRLAAVERPSPTVVPLSGLTLPGGWNGDPQELDAVFPSGSGTLETQIRVPERSGYNVWMGGSFRDRLDLSIDGRSVGSARHQIGLSHSGLYVPMGHVSLAAGLHEARLRYHGPDLHPGSGGRQFSFGPLALSRDTDNARLTFVEPKDARSLCRKKLDWIEALG